MSRKRGQHSRSKYGLTQKRAHMAYDYESDTTRVMVDGDCVGTFPGFSLASRAQAVETLLAHEPLSPPNMRLQDDYYGTGYYEPQMEAQFSSPWDSNEEAERQLAYQKYKAEGHFGENRRRKNAKGRRVQVPEDGGPLDLDE